MAKNFISNKDETARMFKSDFLELMSHVPFYIPLIVFVPVLLFFLFKSIFILHISLLIIAGMFAVGLFVWSITEYVLHRWLFHWMPPGKIGARIHFVAHGVHHDYPSDSNRLVMAPAISIPLAFIFYFSFAFLFGYALVAPFFCGLVAGYLFYDMTHYAIHHYNFKSQFWLDLKNHHMLHHYKDMHNGYGVSSKFWDLIFRTTFKK